MKPENNQEYQKNLTQNRVQTNRRMSEYKAMLA